MASCLEDRQGLQEDEDGDHWWWEGFTGEEGSTFYDKANYQYVYNHGA